MLKPESTLATVWLIILRLVEHYGIDSEALMQDLDLSVERLSDVRARLPSRLADIAFARAAACIPDPAFGLEAARCWHPSNLGTMGYAWLSSRTLHTGLKRMERFSRILGNRFSYHVIQDHSGVRFIYDHGRGDLEIGHAMTDFSLSILMDMCRTNTGRHFPAKQVTLRRPQPNDPSPWQNFFGCKLVFGDRQDSFLLDNVTADAPLPTANIPLANTFDAILTEQMATVYDSDIISRCKAYFLRELTSGEPVAQELATSLGISLRSLQRKLADEGVSYQLVLDETRHELARRYLDDPVRTVTEITFLLGFSEQSAFTRAFRRWSGMSPSTYRGMPPSQRWS